MSQLTEIYLGTSYYCDREDDHNNAMKEFFKALKDCPSLKSLTIAGYDSEVGLEDMELLHNNAPSLENLDLRCISIQPFQQKKIIHKAGNLIYSSSGEKLVSAGATQLKSCKMILMIEPETDLEGSIEEWLIYISLKYSRVEYLEIDCTRDSH